MTSAIPQASLQVVSDELAVTLNDARVVLERYAEGEGGPQSLDRAVALLHTARGVLRMTETHGASLLAEEMEQTCAHLARLKRRDGGVEEQLDLKASVEQALPLILHEVERASADLQCEASLVFPPMDLVGFDSVWKRLGYERRSPESLGVQAWTDAAYESMPTGSPLFFKQLRAERVLRPI